MSRKPRASIPATWSPVEFFSSGSILLDCVLGGGYAYGRIANIVGDKSAGKTLLGIEAARNFYRKEGADAPIVYNEAEAAFDIRYAEQLGLPLHAVQFERDTRTVERWYESLKGVIERAGQQDKAALYILDSLDALSDQAELERKIDDGSYGAAKAKRLSELFRRLIVDLESSKVCVLIISQVRAAMGSSVYGPPTTRAGGRALDFYATQVINLYHKKQLTAQRRGVDRAYGTLVRAKCTKNKVGLPFRDCELEILYGHGVDDVSTCVRWIDKVKGHVEMEMTKEELDFQLKHRFNPDKVDRQALVAKLRRVVPALWGEIDSAIASPPAKYSEEE